MQHILDCAAPWGTCGGSDATSHLDAWVSVAVRVRNHTRYFRKGIYQGSGNTGRKGVAWSLQGVTPIPPRSDKGTG